MGVSYDIVKRQVQIRVEKHREPLWDRTYTCPLSTTLSLQPNEEKMREVHFSPIGLRDTLELVLFLDSIGV